MNIHPDGPIRGDRPFRAPQDFPGADRSALDEHVVYDDGPISFANSLEFLWANKGTLAFATLLLTALSAFYVVNQTSLYTATATVVLETKDNKLVDFKNVLPNISSDDQTMNTELLAMHTPELLARVVDKLQLTKDPEFNPNLRAPGDWGGLMSLSGVRALLGWITETHSPLAAQETRERAAEILGKKVDASIVHDTYAFDISATTESPGKSAKIANTLAAGYVDAQRQVKFDVIKSATKWLGTRAVGLKHDVEAAEAKVEKFAKTASAVNEETVAATTQRLKALRDNQAELLKKATELRRQAKKLEALRTSGDYKSLASSVENQEIKSLAEHLAAGDGGSGQVVHLNSLLGGHVERLRAEAARAESKAEVFKSPIEEIAKQVDAQSADLLKLRQLQREAEAAQLTYKQFLTRMKEVSVQQGVQQADSRILKHANVPRAPSYPHVSATIAGGGVLGFMLGLMLVSVRMSLRKTLQTPEELAGATGRAVIGVIPEQRQHDPVGLLARLVEKPSSAMAEAVRNLRSAVRLSNVDAPPQVLMFTSSVPEEGKTVLSSALAITTAMAGKRVLLLEADFRQRKLQDYFQIEQEAGLAALLSGESSFEDTVIHDDETNLDLLVADDAQVTPVDLFDSDRFSAFLQDMRDIYDLVIVDTPPVLAVPDARVIAQQTDAVVYVVRWDSTTRRMVQAGLDHFEQVNLRVAGLALTRVDPKRMDRYGYYGYGAGKNGKYYAD